jgi:uncharacterized protein (TIGR00245 family)
VFSWYGGATNIYLIALLLTTSGNSINFRSISRHRIRRYCCYQGITHRLICSRRNSLCLRTNPRYSNEPVLYPKTKKVPLRKHAMPLSLLSSPVSSRNAATTTNRTTILPSRFSRRVCFLTLFIVTIVSSLCSINVAPTWAVSSETVPVSALSDALGFSNVAMAAALVSITAGFGLSILAGVPTLARDVMRACARSMFQLFVFGGTILTQLLVAGQTRSWLVWGWISLTACIAANEAFQRVEYTYPRLPFHLLLAFCAGGGIVIGTTVCLGILGPAQPWYSPRIWIPVSGMMLGNALTGTALAAKTVTKEFAINADQVELRLTQGATWREAIAVPLRSVYTTSLTPLMNFLSAAGIVHVPGLMTGQILAGQSPLQAATYQMLVFMLMASTTCTTVQILTRLAVSSIVDQRNDRLQLSVLNRVVKSIGKKRNILIQMVSTIPQFGYGAQKHLRRILFRRRSKFERKQRGINGSWQKINGQQPYFYHMPIYSVALNRSSVDTNANISPILSLQKMRVARTNMDITLDVRYDDRIALTGQSGIGKSQVLRTLAGLEIVDRSTIQLFDVASTQMSMAEWRSHVVLVPQQRPSLEGTPNEFYSQIIKYNSQSKKSNERNVISGYCRLHTEYGNDWGIHESLFDRPWSKLSGGESQRIVLAIALSLQPDVLLLDESTSALDEHTEILVEATLKKLRIPVIMVSHSGTQIDRFCNQWLSLERTANARRPEIPVVFERSV